MARSSSGKERCHVSTDAALLKRMIDAGRPADEIDAVRQSTGRKFAQEAAAMAHGALLDVQARRLEAMRCALAGLTASEEHMLLVPEQLMLRQIRALRKDFERIETLELSAGRELVRRKHGWAFKPVFTSHPYDLHPSARDALDNPES